MELSVNLVLAAVLTLCAASVVGTRPWLKQRMERHESLQTFSVAVALMLVPANLVFTYTGLLSRCNWIVIFGSILAVATQLGLLVLWHRGRDRSEDTTPMQGLPLVHTSDGEPMRVLAVGASAATIDRELGDTLDAFAGSGQEVMALVVADESDDDVASARHTIRLSLPHEPLEDLQLRIAEIAGGHIRQVQPHVILTPTERDDSPGATALHWATRRAARDGALLYYPPRMPTTSELDPMSVETQRERDRAFRRPDTVDEDTDGHVRMPSFAGPWV